MKCDNDKATSEISEELREWINQVRANVVAAMDVEDKVCEQQQPRISGAV